MHTCQHCGAALGDGVRFCPQCGKALDAAALPTMTSPSPVNLRAPMEPRGFSPGSDSHSGSDSFDHGRFAPGTMLGDRYRIVARLGVGGMGEVFRADDLKLGQPVALKFLPESVERDPVRLDKFTAEVRTARQISHPNVCRVYDVGEIDGRRFLTMEYVDGEDLKGLLRRIGRLPEDKGLEIARQICAGLAAIHDRGVLHRDLKPANIMLDGRGRVRLTDFGLATATVGAGADGEIAGTPAYMAPEQLAGQPLSPATDLFALGLVLFEVFTGERVQKGDDAAAIRDAQRAGTSSTLTTSGSGAKLDPMVQRVIERCLDRDPARRPQSAIVVAAALPGGDPLAAALAAGETPSPQMVAAAGEEGGLPLKYAVPLLAAMILGVLLVAWQEGPGSYASRIAFPHSPEVLASKASEMLVRLGYTEPVVGRASGFRPDDAYSNWIEEHDKTMTRWQQLASVKPPVIRFWHRTSPAALIPRDYFGGAPGGGLAVTGLDDPPLTTAGMTYLELDPAGRLVALEAVVADRATPATAPPAPDWTALFREAGLDQSAFASATPEWWGRAPSDARAAWVGTGADATGAELRVEAAAFQGRPVYFRMVAPWSKPTSTPTPQTGAEKAQLAVFLTILLGVPIAAIVLSLRNLRLGRMDTRGATRLAIAGGSVVLLAAVLGSDVTTGEGWIENSFMIASWAAFSAVLIWAFYAAVEPYVRRHWPQMLISWSRLLDGRWRDPLVGRDLLIGAVLSVAVNQLYHAQVAIDAWRGEPPSLVMRDTNTWTGLRSAAAVVISAVPTTLWVALGMVVLLVVLRLLLRREWAAGLAFVAIFAGPSALDGSTPVAILFTAVVAAIFALVATRFGLVMFAAMLLTGNVLSRSGGFSTPEFATSAVFLAMAVAVAPGVFGFFTATRGRKHTAWLDG